MAGSTAGASIGQVVIPVPINCGRICGRYQGILYWEVCSRTGCILTIRNPDSENQANHVLVGGVCITVILNLDNLL